MIEVGGSCCRIRRPSVRCRLTVSVNQPVELDTLDPGAARNVERLADDLDAPLHQLVEPLPRMTDEQAQSQRSSIDHAEPEQHGGQTATVKSTLVIARLPLVAIRDYLSVLTGS